MQCCGAIIIVTAATTGIQNTGVGFFVDHIKAKIETIMKVYGDYCTHDENLNHFDPCHRIVHPRSSKKLSFADAVSGGALLKAKG